MAPNNHRFIFNGRIVSSARPLFSWRRFILWASLVSILLALNPVNSPWSLHHLLQQHGIELPWIKPAKRTYSPSRLTNWGLFAIEDGISRVRLIGLGGEYKCYFAQNSICKPLQSFFQKRHNVHSFLLAIHALATLFVLSCRNPRGIKSKTVLIQILYDLFLPSLEYPLLSFVSSALWSKVTLSTAIEQMQNLLLSQAPDSLFCLLPRSSPANLYLSTACLVVLAAGFASSVRLFANLPTRRGGGWTWLNSAALGYCTLVRAPFAVSPWRFAPYALPVHFNYAQVSWLALLFQWTFGGFWSMIEWTAAYYGGYVLGLYQVNKNNIWASVTRDLEYGLQGLLHSLFGTMNRY
jgi:hypothetical protein